MHEHPRPGSVRSRTKYMIGAAVSLCHHISKLYGGQVVNETLKKIFFFSITTCVLRQSSGTLKALHNHPHKYIHIQTMEGNLLVNWSWTGQENNVLDEAKRKKLSNGKKEVLSLNTTFSLWKTRKGSLKDKTASLDTCLVYWFQGHIPEPIGNKVQGLNWLAQDKNFAFVEVWS